MDPCQPLALDPSSYPGEELRKDRRARHAEIALKRDLMGIATA